MSCTIVHSIVGIAYVLAESHAQLYMHIVNITIIDNCKIARFVFHVCDRM